MGSFVQILKALFENPVYACVGGALLIYTFMLIIINEYFTRRHLKVIDILQSSLRTIVNISANDFNNDSLIFIYGKSDPLGPTVDPETGISCPESCILYRYIEVLNYTQYCEIRRDASQVSSSQMSTNYSYPVKWTRNIIDSSTYTNKNYKNEKKHFFMKNGKIYNPEIRIGAFKLNFSLVEQLKEKKTKFILNSAEAPEISPEFQSKLKSIYGTYNVLVQDGDLYIKQNMQEDISGDLKITYWKVPTGPLSVIGRQKNDLVVPFNIQKLTSENKDISEYKDASKTFKQLDDNEDINGANKGLVCRCALSLFKGLLYLIILPFVVNYYIPRAGYIINWLEEEFLTKEAFISKRTSTSFFKFIFLELLTIIYVTLALAIIVYPIKEQVAREQTDSFNIYQHYILVSFLVGNATQFLLKSFYWIMVRNCRAIICFCISLSCIIGVIVLYLLHFLQKQVLHFYEEWIIQNQENTQQKNNKQLLKQYSCMQSFK